jgi:hypothetical protein
MLSSMIACNRALYPKSNPFVPEDFTPRYGRGIPVSSWFFLFQLQYPTSQSLKRKLKVAGSYDIPSANAGGMDGEFHQVAQRGCRLRSWYASMVFSRQEKRSCCWVIRAPSVDQRRCCTLDGGQSCRRRCISLCSGVELKRQRCSAGWRDAAFLLLMTQCRSFRPRLYRLDLPWAHKR